MIAFLAGAVSRLSIAYSVIAANQIMRVPALRLKFSGVGNLPRPFAVGASFCCCKNKNLTKSGACLG